MYQVNYSSALLLNTYEIFQSFKIVFSYQTQWGGKSNKKGQELNVNTKENLPYQKIFYGYYYIALLHFLKYYLITFI